MCSLCHRSAGGGGDTRARGQTRCKWDAGRTVHELAEIGELIESGRFSLLVAPTFPLAEIAQAHRVSENGHVRGKLVLVVGARLHAGPGEARGRGDDGAVGDAEALHHLALARPDLFPAAELTLIVHLLSTVTAEASRTSMHPDPMCGQGRRRTPDMHRARAAQPADDVQPLTDRGLGEAVLIGERHAAHGHSRPRQHPVTVF